MDATTKRRQFEDEALPHLDAMYGFALRLANGDESRADDLVQDALLNAYRSWHTYERGSNCKAWLMAILRNTMISRYRTESRHEPRVEYEEIGERTVFDRTRATDPEGTFFARIVDEEVLRAIDRLPPSYRETLVLSDLEGLSYPEIVEVLDVPVGTVKSRLFRARRALQEDLYDYAVEMGYIRGVAGRAEGAVPADASPAPGARRDRRRFAERSVRSAPRFREAVPASAVA